MRLIVSLLLLLAGPARGEAVPVFSPTGPDADAYGAAENYPVTPPGSVRTQKNLVGAFSHADQIGRTRPVPHAASPSVWRRASAEIDVRYNFRGRWGTLADYLSRHPTTGLLIAHDDVILFEHYQYGRTDRDRLTSQSMAKTVLGTLVGVALGEGKIKSLDEPASTYLPALAGTELGRTPIRALLTMTGGMHFSEDYGGTDDNGKLMRDLFRRDSPGGVAAVAQFTTRVAEPGAAWNYAGLYTETLGLVLQAAVTMPLADYLATRIWQPIGTEADANWAIDAKGQEVAPCCFNAVLRDWARFGRLLAFDGAWNGIAIVPHAYLIEASTRPQTGPLAQVRFSYGYGYQVWLPGGNRRQYSLQGIHGQMLFVDPASKLILVHTAVRAKPTGDPMAGELGAVWNALVAEQAGK